MFNFVGKNLWNQWNIYKIDLIWFWNLACTGFKKNGFLTYPQAAEDAFLTKPCTSCSFRLKANKRHPDMTLLCYWGYPDLTSDRNCMQASWPALPQTQPQKDVVFGLFLKPVKLGQMRRVRLLTLGFKLSVLKLFSCKIFYIIELFWVLIFKKKIRNVF